MRRPDGLRRASPGSEDPDTECNDRENTHDRPHQGVALHQITSTGDLIRCFVPPAGLEPATSKV